MPPLSTVQPFFQKTWNLVDQKSGIGAEWFLAWLDSLASQQASIIQVLNASLGVNVFVRAGQPTLGAGDAGYLGYVSDYAHLVRWTGAIWEWFGGDDNNYVALRPAAPVGNGWQLCDGTVTDYLVVGGAALTTAPFTTPDSVGTPNYPKTAGAYTGAIVAPSAPGLSGNTATWNTPLSLGFSTSTDVQPPQTVQAGAGASVPAETHDHHVADVDVAHLHGKGSLAVDATGEPRHLGWLQYFRR